MHWKTRSWTLIGLLLAVMHAAGLAQIATTQIADTIYHADGTVATGTVVVSWPAFTTGSGEAIASSSLSATIAANGALSLSLTPNAGSNPMGSYYTAVFHLDDGTVSKQYWVVPVSTAPVKLANIASTVLPTSVALQTVSKSYVDTAIAAAVTGHPLDSTPYVLKAGDTMTGPLSLPADPVSPLQAADKNYVDTSVAAVSGGLGQKVSTVPTATQTVTQPTGTQLQVNLLNGVEYAKQYVNGLGSNGVANATASPDCVGGCDVTISRDYTGDAVQPGTLTSQTHIVDARGGMHAETTLNPLDVVNHGLSSSRSLTAISTQSTASLFAETGNQDPGEVGLYLTQKALAGGSNLLPTDIDTNVPYFKMGYSALELNGIYNTQGQHVMVPEETDCYGVGDCLIGSQFVYASGGFRDVADEGAHPFDLEIHEDSRVFAGTCTVGCTTGSTSLTLAPTANGGTQGDGRFLIDLNPAKTITSAGTGGAIVGGNNANPHATVQFSGTSFPVSVFLSTAQAIQSQANNQAPGTVTFAIATTGQPAGYAANTAAIGSSSGVACVVDQTSGFSPHNYEMASYTVVDATHLRMTLNKPHKPLATLAFGGLCGYGLEQTVDTVGGLRQVFPVVGAYSPTQVYYAAGLTPVLGAMNQTGGYLNVSIAIATLARSGGTVTVTTSGNLPADLNGLTVTLAGIADSSYNGSFPVTTTGPNTFTYAQAGANSTSNGGTASVLTGGFAFYPMAEVLSVLNASSNAVDGTMTLAPNTVAWAANDPIEEPHYFQESVYADTEYVGQSVPRPTVSTRAGVQYQQNNAAGLTGWSIENGAPNTNYQGYGGTHTAPDAAYKSTGIWKRTMNLTAGELAAFAVHCNLHGCGNWNSGYNLFELDTPTGYDTVKYTPATSTLNYTLNGTSYTLSPQALTAGTIDVGTLNATKINGTLSATAAIVSGTIDGAVIGGTTPAAVTATQLNGLAVGEYQTVSRGAMKTVLEALHNAKSQAVNILLLGDSFTACDYTNCGVGPSAAANKWSTQLRTALQAAYGSHGTGMVPVYYNIGSAPNPEGWAVTGTFDFSTTTLGPSQSAGLPGGGLLHLANGAVASFTSAIPYDTVRAYCMTTAATGSLAVSIDGVSQGTACGTTTASPTAHVAASATVALGVHTTTFTSTGDSYLYAAEGTAGSVGVSVHNLAIGGATSEMFGVNPATKLAFSDLIPGGTQAAVVFILTNDVQYTPSLSTFTTQMSNILTHESGLAGTPSVLLAVPPIDSLGATAETPYLQAEATLAESLQAPPVGFVSVPDRWGHAYDNTSGLWDLAGTYGGIHPNDKGSLDEADLIYSALVSGSPIGASAGGGCSSGCTFTGSTTLGSTNTTVVGANGQVTSNAPVDNFVATSAAGGTGDLAVLDGHSVEAGAFGYANPGFSSFLGGTTFIYSAVHPICLSATATGCDLTVNSSNGGFVGPATAPTGACSVVAWVFSQDGHATFCNGSAWIAKI